MKIKGREKETKGTDSGERKTQRKDSRERKRQKEKIAK